MVEGAVSRQPVKPGTQGNRTRVREDGVVGRHEDLLEHVLGILGGTEHLPAERPQACLIALDERVEGAGMAPADERDQLLVALEA